MMSSFYPRIAAKLILCAAPVFLMGQTAPPPANLLNPVGSNYEDAFQINYSANLDIADGVVNVINAGSSAGTVTPGSTTASGGMCANVYVYGPTSQLLSCCSCATNPNGLYSWPVIFGPGALLANALTKPSSVAVKIVATAPATTSTAGQLKCDATFATAPLSLVPGLAAWETHPHRTPSTAIGIAETPFDSHGLSIGEALRLQNDCTALGTAGQCPGCLNSGLAVPAGSLTPSL